MKKLADKVNKLKNTGIGETIRKRSGEFASLGKRTTDKIFEELCFCLLTANFNAERGIKMQKEIGAGFHNLTEKEMAAKLRKVGHRFPNMRAKFICEARKHKKDLASHLKKKTPDREFRLWLAENVKGLGLKESSHFLRNIGRTDCAIIDFHIIDLMAENGLMEPCESLSKKKYLEAEQVLEKLAGKVGISLGELDLYLWYLETGRILK